MPTTESERLLEALRGVREDHFEGTDAAGRATVTVDGIGLVTGVRLSPRGARADADVLAEAVLAGYAEAESVRTSALAAITEGDRS